MAQLWRTAWGNGESRRWHEGRLWLCNWATGEVLAVGTEGRSTLVARVQTTVPYSVDSLLRRRAEQAQSAGA